MAKVITFSTKFPSYHPKVGQPTYFVEKFYNSLFSRNNLMDYPKGLTINESILEKKHHTIRAGKRFKKGDYFSPRVWSGRPYYDPQITIAPDTLITDVYDFEINGSEFKINENIYDGMNMDLLEKIATNDGLSKIDLLNWFKYPKPFSGQIICWNKYAQY